MRYKGRVIEWNDDRGFGFAHPATGGDRVFLHIKSFANRQRRPVVGEIVLYELGRDSKGRPQGLNVSYSGAATPKAATPGPGPVSLAFAVLFLLAVAVAVVTEKLPPIALLVYAVASAVTFMAYWWDKAAARSNDWRTAESTLHLLSLVGGWPGALIAQNVLRHKSKKQSFRVEFWITVLFNCCALVYAYVQIRAGKW